jgi:hypothetical protein
LNSSENPCRNALPSINTSISPQLLGFWVSENPGQFTQRFPYNTSFGDTSSVVAGAAGVAALVLSIAPSLTLIELRRILRRACDPIDTSSLEAPYDCNGHSIYYGYGRILDPIVLVVRLQRSR